MYKLFISKNYIEIKCAAEHSHRVLTNFYPVTYNRKRTVFRLSPRLLPEVLKEFRNIDESNIDTLPQQVQDAFYNELAIRKNTEDLLTNGPRKSGRVSDRLTLLPHQQLGRELAQYHDKFAFYYDTRTGKTPLALTIIYDDLCKNPNHKWLVVCPLILIYNAWLEDLKKFFPDIPAVNCHGRSPEDRFKAFKTDANIYLMNTEAFTRYYSHIQKIGVMGCVLDESSAMKSPKSKISNTLVEFAQSVDRFYLLAGTPAPNGEWEYYMQMRAIDYYGWQPYYSHYKNYYFDNYSRNPQYDKLKIKPDKLSELLENVKRKALYVDKEDVLNLPGRTFHEVEYTMPEQLMKHYRKFKNDLYVEFTKQSEPIRITAPSTAAKLNKLNQISSGFILDTNAIKHNKFHGTNLVEWYLLDDIRFKKLQELLNTEGIKGEQVLIWANYHKEFEIIKELLGDSCACVYGKTPIAEKNKAIADFKSGRVQYLVANPASADKGLTLTNTHIAIYFSLNWSFELFKQSYDRIYGAKSIQPYHCDYYILLAKGTIDKILYENVLQGKSNAAYAVLNHLKPGDEAIAGKNS